MFNTDFMNLWEELSYLNEAILFPRSGWVVVNEDNKFFAKNSSSNNGRIKIWTDIVEEAVIFKTEEAAYKARRWCGDYYQGRGDFWVKKVESKKDVDKAELENFLFTLLDLWEKFVDTGVDFQKLCNHNDFKNFSYSKADYVNKKSAPDLLIYILNSDDNINEIVNKLGKFAENIIKESKKEKTDQDLQKRLKAFVEAWHAFVQKLNSLKSVKWQLCELLKDLK